MERLLKSGEVADSGDGKKRILGALNVSDFVDLAISTIPSSFGKLTFLAGLRDESTGRYTDPLAALLYGNQLDAVLERRHREFFLVWLGLDLVTQTTQVAQYLAVDDEVKTTLVKQWIKERRYEKLAPPAAREVERKLFVSDLITILLLLQDKLNFGEESHS